jgi:hypothetical protein
VPLETSMKIAVFYQVRLEVATRNEYGDYCLVSNKV